MEPITLEQVKQAINDTPNPPQPTIPDTMLPEEWRDRDYVWGYRVVKTQTMPQPDD